MKTNNSKYIKSLTGISVLATLFHLLILIRIIPFEITWGGRLKTVEEMYVLEGLSILINSFFIIVVLQRGKIIRYFTGRRAVNIILWVFFVIFVLNTIGNLFAKTNFEKLFSLVTGLSAILIWIILKEKKSLKD